MRLFSLTDEEIRLIVALRSVRVAQRQMVESMVELLADDSTAEQPSLPPQVIRLYPR